MTKQNCFLFFVLAKWTLINTTTTTISSKRAFIFIPRKSLVRRPSKLHLKAHLNPILPLHLSDNIALIASTSNPISQHGS